MGRLVIELSFSGKIVISPDNCREDSWYQAVLFWTKGRVRAPLPTKVEIDIADFANRMAWLRYGWKDTAPENTFSINEEVKAGIKQLRADAEEFDRISSLTSVPEVEINLENIARPLTRMQIENVARLLRMKNGANFSVPGAGKTATQLALWDHLRQNGVVKGLLVVCPKSAFTAWTEEPKEIFEVSPKVEIFNGGYISYTTSVLLVNYEQLENFDKLAALKDWLKAKEALLVVDEAHRVKAGASAVRWRACRELSEVAVRTDLLTGTPMPQSFEDLKNLFSLSWTGVSPNHFSEPRLRGLKRGGVFVRTTKTELGLPAMKTVVVPIQMGELQKQIYDALRFAYSGELQMSAREELQMARRGRAIMTLLGAASNPGLIMGKQSEDAFLDLRWPPRIVQPGSRLLPNLQEYVSHEVPSKYQWILRFVADAQAKNRKVLIWSNFVGNLRSLHRLLKPFNPAMVYGFIPYEQRQSELHRFRTSNTCSVLLTNPQTLGEGISLHHECHDAVYLDRSYNAGLYLQSLDRIHRLGLDPNQETRIYILKSIGSIDDRVDSRLAQKISLLGKAMDDTGLLQASLPNDELSDEEIIGFDSFDFDDLAGHLNGD